MINIYFGIYLPTIIHISPATVEDDEDDGEGVCVFDRRAAWSVNKEIKELASHRWRLKSDGQGRFGLGVDGEQAPGSREKCVKTVATCRVRQPLAAASPAIDHGWPC